MKLASLNFLQLAVRAAQAGVGEAVEKQKASNGEMRAIRGQGTRVWQGLVTRYEKQIPWLKQGELKEVSLQMLYASLLSSERHIDTSGFLLL